MLGINNVENIRKVFLVNENKKSLYSVMGIVIFLSITGCASAQTLQKKTYTADLDTLWSRNTYINKITTDGDWVVFTEAYDHKKNVLFLKHTTKNVTFKFPESQWIRFSNDNRWFGCVSTNKELHIIDLQKHTQKTYGGINSYAFSKSGDYVAIFQKHDKTEGKLLIMDLSTQTIIPVESVEGTTAYSWHPKRNVLLIIVSEKNQNKVIRYNVENLSTRVLKEKHNTIYKNLVWSDSGNAIIFSEQSNQKNQLHYFTFQEEGKTLNDDLLEKKFSHYKISDRPPYISNDGKKIIFYRQTLDKDKSDGTGAVKIWNSDNTWLYPKMQKYKERELQYQLTAWYPKTNKLIAIETNETPTAALDINHKYAVVFNKLKYEPLYKEFPNADIYVRNLESGEKHLVIQNQYTGSGFVKISPSGKYITYFKDDHWWVFDIEKQQATNLTKDIKVSFENCKKYYGSGAFPFGNPGWSENEEYIVLYDQYDIWLISPDASYKKRITTGREEKIQYRISRDYRRNEYYFLTVNIKFSSSPFDLHKGVILEMYNTNLHKSGYASWRLDNKVKRIIFESKEISDILISEDFNNIIFKKQRFDMPPGIYRINLKTNKQNLIYQSNENLLNYDLGRAKLIKYKSGQETLLGALIYPSNFNPKNKYPMIVSIYEKVSGIINYFHPPSNYEYIGFNTLRYTTNGYFVFYPDIAYKVRDPGISALRSVKSAVNKVLESGFVNKDKIGLIGHSFGGYESAFIATQTNMFAAIVAGAPVTDITSHYHSVGWNWDQPEIWRYEHQQWRMGNSYYNIKEAYFRNSPIRFVENVTTPILLWTGKEDYQVNWTQSIEMFLALKRLDKKSKLLLIENERHVIRNKGSQTKLSNEIMKWFEEYCK